MTAATQVARTNKPPRAGGPAYNDGPFACVLCGKPDLRSLCRPCRLAHAGPDGHPPPWLAALQREGWRLTGRARRTSPALISLDALEEGA